MIGAGNNKQVGMTLELCILHLFMSVQFGLFAQKILKTPTLAEDARFATNAARVANRDELVQIITEALMKQDRCGYLPHRGLPS